MDIYAVKLEESIENAKVKKLLSHVSQERRAKIKRFLHQKDVYRSLIGDILIRTIICKKLRVNNDQIIFVRNNYGKPFLKNHPNFYFNVSHSGDWVVGAIDEKKIGIDIEKIKPIEFQIAENFFTEEEYNELIAKNQKDRLSYFYDLWTLKESYIKAVGKGLSIPLNKFTIIIDDKDSIIFKSKALNSSYKFKQYKIDKRYKMAVCTNGKIEKDGVTVLSLDQIINQFEDYI